MDVERKFQKNQLNQIFKLTTLQVDHVTCIECCKYYIVPTTAICGHTLCHSCWHGRQNCPVCGLKLDRKTLRLNLVLQYRTENIHHLADAFKDLFNIKLDDFLLSPEGNLPTEKNHNNNVNDWLASSQNHFSAPVSSQNSIQELNLPQKLIVNDIQVHTKSKKSISPTKAIFVPIEQKDWDKIEELPDSEDILNKDKENIIGPMDIETYNFIPNDDDNTYSNDNPRRSSRKKDTKESVSTKSSKVSKINKNNKNWTNVKKMKKEFSKLNTQNKNKLNVSIEMCKKVKSCNNINKITSEPVQKIFSKSKENYENDSIINDERLEKNHNASNKRIDEVPTITENLNINNTKEITHGIERSPNSGDKSRYLKSKNIVEINSTELENEKEVNKPNVCFFKKNLLLNKDMKKTIIINDAEDVKSEAHDTDDIEITIKIGSTLTNICIKKKENDVQLKINSDREVQTTVDKHCSGNKISVSTSPIKEISHINAQYDKNVQFNSREASPKSQKLKINTASADTSTVNAEITASIERELSTVMENVPSGKPENVTSAVPNVDNKTNQDNNDLNVVNDVEFNDLDIFDTESVKEGNVQSLKALGQVPSTILVPTSLSKTKSQKNTTKRVRDATEVDTPPCSKKSKIQNSKPTQQKQHTQKSQNDSDLVNYDEIMSQVFANIDADMKNMHKSKENENIQNSVASLQSQGKKVDKGNATQTQKYSENIFSFIEKDSEETKNTTAIDSTKINIESVTNDKKILEEDNMIMVEMGTPLHNDDGSDQSVVDETPQKSTSFTKAKHSDLIINKDKVLKLNQYGNLGASKDQKKIDESQGIAEVTSFSGTVADSSRSSRNITVVEQPKQSINFTPLSIHKFVGQIKHNSTPVSRKSLKFSESVDADLDKTHCPSQFAAARNTQEMEIMSKAFEQNNVSSLNLMAGKDNKRNQTYYVAASCLSLSEKNNVKQLCAQRNWVFSQNYTKELTHLIVSVDEEKKAQRSAKFICALAASKWIVAYEWVEKCLQTNQIVDEEPYEALDGTGEPGPRRSRLAKVKIFDGIKFFCMPPFGVLDVDTLKEIVESAGGTVVNEARAVRVTHSPALLLAEPESTQEDRFIYLAMELCIVPVNYEWVLNCLGSYSLCSIHELLLCPSSLLPPATAKWPSALIARENDSLIE